MRWSWSWAHHISWTALSTAWKRWRPLAHLVLMLASAPVLVPRPSFPAPRFSGQLQAKVASCAGPRATMAPWESCTSALLGQAEAMLQADGRLSLDSWLAPSRVLGHACRGAGEHSSGESHRSCSCCHSSLCWSHLSDSTVPACPDPSQASVAAASAVQSLCSRLPVSSEHTTTTTTTTTTAMLTVNHCAGSTHTLLFPFSLFSPSSKTWSYTDTADLPTPNARPIAIV